MHPSEAKNMILFINLDFDHRKVYLRVILLDYIHYISLLTISYYILFLIADFWLFPPQNLRNL